MHFTNAPESSCDPLVAKIIEIDSWCGKRWDEYCVVAYNDCYELTECNENDIDAIANAANVDRTRIDCPIDEGSVVTLAPIPLPGSPAPFSGTIGCPNTYPGTGEPCSLTNLQCIYILSDTENDSDSEWLCNCGQDPMEFYCKPKNS
jgi:hypothetical protein